MKKIIYSILTILILTSSTILITSCNNVSQEEHNALLAENEQLKQQLAQYEEAAKNQTQKNSASKQNANKTTPASASDFVYVNNGSEVQINGYKGNGGHVVIPTEIEGSIVTRIARNAFENAENITSIKLPEKLQFIGAGAFECLYNLTGVLIVPKSVTIIENNAFESTQLTGVVIKSNCFVGVNAFSYNNLLEFVYVEEGCSPEFASAFNDNESLTIAIFPNSMTDIHDETFMESKNMVIYTTSGSYAEAYANRNFIGVDTESYEEQKANFSKIY